MAETPGARWERLEKLITGMTGRHLLAEDLVEAIIDSDRAAGCDPETLLAELAENETVIAVWRGRTLRAEAERDEARAEVKRVRNTLAARLAAVTRSLQYIKDEALRPTDNPALLRRCVVVQASAALGGITPSSGNVLADLDDFDRLESLASELLAKKWHVKIGAPETRIFNGVNRVTQTVEFSVSIPTGKGSLEILLEDSQAAAKFCAAASPSAILKLIAALRAARADVKNAIFALDGESRS